MKFSVGEDNKAKVVEIDLGLFEYYSGYDDDGNFVRHWEIHWEDVIVAAFVGWVVYEAFF